MVKALHGIFAAWSLAHGEGSVCQLLDNGDVDNDDGTWHKFVSTASAWTEETPETALLNE